MIEIEKIPSPTCDSCGSYHVIFTDDGFECDNCNSITVQTSDLLKQRDKLKKLTLDNFGEIDEIR